MSQTLHPIQEPKTRQLLAANGQVHQVSTAPPSGWQRLTTHPLWELAFRPWFLLAALCAIASLGVWLAYLQGLLGAWPVAALSPVVWHVHEMLFGFAATVAVAFLLTAVQTWTGLRSLHGGPLIALTLLWLINRVVLWQPYYPLTHVALLLQGLWWLGCIVVFTRLVIRSRNQRNYQFIPLLLMMMLLNLGMLWADSQQQGELALHLARSAIVLFTLLVGIVGGRVIPFFTGRGAPTARVITTPRLDMVLLGLMLLMVFSFLLQPLWPEVLSLWVAPLLIVCGVLHGCRLAHWDSWATRTVPLLWSLHLTYLTLALGLIAMGLSFYWDAVRFADALHLITVGTLGGMILAMMARVSLGHTGRPLQPHRIISVAFALMLIAALLRLVLPIVQQPLLSWQIAVALWWIAFGCFVVVYAPILTRARQ